MSNSVLFNDLPINFQELFNWLDFSKTNGDPINADLVFEMGLDEDSLYEILESLEDEYRMSFDIALSRHYPSVFSIYYSEWLMGIFPILKRTRKEKFIPIRILDIWGEISMKRTK